MRILTVSHSCATAINQEIHARIRQDKGWKIKLVVLRQLSAQPDHHKMMGANLRKCVEENYTWDRISQMTGNADREATKC